MSYGKLKPIITVILKVINTMKIGLFYGSTTCYTEMAAEKIRDIIGAEIVDLYNIKDDSLNLIEQYDFLIFVTLIGAKTMIFTKNLTFSN